MTQLQVAVNAYVFFFFKATCMMLLLLERGLQLSRLASQTNLDPSGLTSGACDAGWSQWQAFCYRFHLATRRHAEIVNPKLKV